jgi:hypothetical protein
METHVAWNKEQLTRLVEKNLPNKFDVDKDESGDISWVRHDMTPLHALKKSRQRLDEATGAKSVETTDSHLSQSNGFELSN